MCDFFIYLFFFYQSTLELAFLSSSSLSLTQQSFFQSMEEDSSRISFAADVNVIGYSAMIKFNCSNSSCSYGLFIFVKFYSLPIQRQQPAGQSLHAQAVKRKSLLLS